MADRDRLLETERMSRGDAPSPTVHGPLVFRILDGERGGETVTLEGHPVSIGSVPESVLMLPDSTVSRRHARIELQGDDYLLRDLGSTNGTYLEGGRIREAWLQPGSRIRIGAVSMVFQDHEDAPESEEVSAFGDLVGEDAGMRRLFRQLRRLVDRNVTLIIRGETGTGKELAGRGLHELSRRRDGPFQVLDCSAVHPDLISSEIFGHVSGAFTGAERSRAGAFELADGGTLFMDELGELPLDLQAKLLRVLETRVVRRLGSETEVSFDCQVIAATHRDLMAMVETGTFREDLYYRLAQVVVEIPPLRARLGDIPLLVDRFLEEARQAHGDPHPYRFDDEAMARLTSLEYRGNVRELRNIVASSVALAQSEVLTIGDLNLPRPPSGGTAVGKGLAGSVEEAEKETIRRALEENQYHRSRTARQLGISLPTLRDRVRRFGLWVPGRGTNERD